MENDPHQGTEETIKNRRIALEMTNKAAMRGHGICAALFALESFAAPFYLGLDEDPDDSDLDVFP
jgi:hypothetical protein